MMVLNGPASNANVPMWSETFSVKPGTAYAFKFWSASSAGQSTYIPVLQAYVNGVAAGSPLTLPTHGGRWVSSSGTWDSGSATSATFYLTDLQIQEAQNDFVLDHIRFYTAGVVPEPSTWAMMLVGLSALGGLARNRRRISRQS